MAAFRRTATELSSRIDPFITMAKRVQSGEIDRT
jgi:hypothetical protein